MFLQPGWCGAGGPCRAPNIRSVYCHTVGESLVNSSWPNRTETSLLVSLSSLWLDSAHLTPSGRWCGVAPETSAAQTKGPLCGAAIVWSLIEMQMKATHQGAKSLIREEQSLFIQSENHKIIFKDFIQYFSLTNVQNYYF